MSSLTCNVLVRFCLDLVRCSRNECMNSIHDEPYSLWYRGSTVLLEAFRYVHFANGTNLQNHEAYKTFAAVGCHAVLATYAVWQCRQSSLLSCFGITYMMGYVSISYGQCLCLSVHSSIAGGKCQDLVWVDRSGVPVFFVQATRTLCGSHLNFRFDLSLATAV